MISIILVAPEHAGNVGAVCRVMQNFGLLNLILINPRFSLDDEELLKRAKNAKSVVRKIRVEKMDVLKEFDYLIGTTALLGSDYNIARVPLTPREVASKVVGLKNSVGIVFGPESSGLTNTQIRKCDMICSIPSSPRYKTLNLSHAVGIICYELFIAKNNSFSSYKAATKAEKDALIKKINTRLNTMTFSTKEKKETQKLVWKKILGKGFLTKREVFALHGFFSKK